MWFVLLEIIRLDMQWEILSVLMVIEAVKTHAVILFTAGDIASLTQNGAH